MVVPIHNQFNVFDALSADVVKSPKLAYSHLNSLNHVGCIYRWTGTNGCCSKAIEHHYFGMVCLRVEAKHTLQAFLLSLYSMYLACIGFENVAERLVRTPAIPRPSHNAAQSKSLVASRPALVNEAEDAFI